MVRADLRALPEKRPPHSFYDDGFRSHESGLGAAQDSLDRGVRANHAFILRASRAQKTLCAPRYKRHGAAGTLLKSSNWILGQLRGDFAAVAACVNTYSDDFHKFKQIPHMPFLMHMRFVATVIVRINISP